MAIETETGKRYPESHDQVAAMRATENTVSDAARYVAEQQQIWKSKPKLPSREDTFKTAFEDPCFQDRFKPYSARSNEIL